MDYSRQIEIFNPEEHNEIIEIAGCGSVGSFTALALAKMGVKLGTIYDSDIVAPHNLPNQFFGLAHLGVKKRDALAQLISSFIEAPEFPAYLEDNVNETTIFVGHIVISAVDSMEARKLIWNRAKESPEVKYYIDSRMGGKVFRLFVVNMHSPDSIKKYEKTLHSDDDAAQLRCTERTIIFNVLGVAGLICSKVSKILNGKDFKEEIAFDYETLELVK